MSDSQERGRLRASVILNSIVVFLVVGALIATASMAIIGYTTSKPTTGAATAMYYDQVVPLIELGKVDSALSQMYGEIYRFLLYPSGRDNSKSTIQKSIATVNESMLQYKITYLEREELNELSNFDTAWAGCQKSIATIVAQIDQGETQIASDSLSEGGVFSLAYQTTQASVNRLGAIKARLAEEANQQTDETPEQSSTRMLFAGIIVGVLIIGLGLACSVGMSLYRRRT